MNISMPSIKMSSPKIGSVDPFNIMGGINKATGFNLGKVDPFNLVSDKDRNKSIDQLSVGDVQGFINQGEKKGEIVTGTTMDEAGQGRAEVRDRLQETLNGQSAGANSLRQDQNYQAKALKANQAMQGGGQMDAGQQQALARQNQRDLANFVSGEKRQALSDLSKEWRGAGSDIMQAGGQYGSILVGSQAPQNNNNGGLISDIFGGLF